MGRVNPSRGHVWRRQAAVEQAGAKLGQIPRTGRSVEIIGPTVLVIDIARAGPIPAFQPLARLSELGLQNPQLVGNSAEVKLLFNLAFVPPHV